MASSEEVTAGTDVETLVHDYEQGKEKKGYKRTDTNALGVKTLSYLRPNDGNELVREPMEVSAYESTTTKGIKKSIAQAELRHEHFKQCLLENIRAPDVYIPSLRSVNHRVYQLGG